MLPPTYGGQRRSLGRRRDDVVAKPADEVGRRLGRRPGGRDRREHGRLAVTCSTFACDTDLTPCALPICFSRWTRSGSLAVRLQVLLLLVVLLLLLLLAAAATSASACCWASSGGTPSATSCCAICVRLLGRLLLLLLLLLLELVRAASGRCAPAARSLTAIRNGPLTPGPEALVERVVGLARPSSTSGTARSPAGRAACRAPAARARAGRSTATIPDDQGWRPTKRAIRSKNADLWSRCSGLWSFGDRQRLDPVAEQREQRRQQGQRAADRDDDHDRGAVAERADDRDVGEPSARAARSRPCRPRRRRRCPRSRRRARPIRRGRGRRGARGGDG